MLIILFLVVAVTYGVALRYFALLFTLGSRNYRKNMAKGSGLLNADPTSVRLYKSISVN